MDDWTCVYSSPQRYQAELVKGLLSEADIEAVILDKKDSAYTIFGDIEVYVQPENENLAIEIVKDAKI